MGILATSIQHFYFSRGWATALIILVLWELVWKMIALWHAGRNNQLGWFLVIGIINTAGILEIIYLLFFQRTEPDTK